MKLPVLIYHAVLSRDYRLHHPTADRYYTLDYERFLKHLHFLSNNDFQTIQLETAINPKTNSVVLTFDDGFESHYKCFQLLNKFNFTATFFISTDFVDTDGYLTWQQLREMHTCGANIQSHTCSHPILTEISLEQIHQEFMNSKHIIEDNLNKVVNSISIPHGFINNMTIKIAQECGYKYIYTSDPGVHDTEYGHIVKRLTIFNRTTISQFKRIVRMNSFEIAKMRLYKSILSIPKNILGNRNYHLIRNKILSNSG